jgi:flagellar hook-associated protein 3 FlgL
VRVADSNFYDRMRNDLGLRRQALDSAQSHAESGQRVEKPSDDPQAFAHAQQYNALHARAAQHEQTAGATLSSLQTADGALADADNLMQRARDLAVEGANDTLTASDRAALAQEVSQLRDQLVTIANTQDGGRYLFGGYKDGSPPYDGAGNYSGDTSAQQVEVAPGVTMPLGLSGDRVFGAAGGQDLFVALTSLQTALNGNNGSASSAAIASLDLGLEQVRTSRSQLGNHMNAAQAAQSVAQRVQDTATASRSKLVDVDTAVAYTDLAQAQAALSAAVQIAGQLPPPGLVQRAR